MNLSLALSWNIIKSHLIISAVETVLCCVNMRVVQQFTLHEAVGLDHLMPCLHDTYESHSFLANIAIAVIYRQLENWLAQIP